MPRAFDRGIPAVDKNPLISATSWGDPATIIGEAAAGAGSRIQTFLFGLFEGCGEFVTGLAEFGSAFLTDLLETLITQLEQAIDDADEALAGALTETIEQIRTSLASPNPLVLIGSGLQAFVDQFYKLLFCGADPGITPQAILTEVGGWITPLAERWAAFLADWFAINWLSLTSVHTAWMLVVDLITDLWNILTTKIESYFSITAFPDFFEAEVFKAAWQAFNTAWAAINFTSPTALWNALRAVLKLGRDLVHWLAQVFSNISGIDVETLLQSLGVTALAAAFTAFGNTIAGINWTNLTAIFTAIGAFITLSQDLGNWFLDLIDSWLGWDTGIVGAMFDSFSAFVSRMVEYFFGATGLAGWITALETLAGVVGATITEAISALYNQVARLGRLLGGFPNIAAFVDRIAALFGLSDDEESPFGLEDLVNNIPFLGPLISKITGLDSSGDTALDLTNLGTWAQNLLTQTSNIPADRLIGSIPAAILGAIPVSSINFTAGNLLSQGAFLNANTVETAGGWSWDGATSATPLIGGGSVKATGTGSLQQLYSRQTIKVAAGDRVEISAKVKTSGFTSGSMVLSVVPWIGTTAQTAHVVHTRTTSAASFSAMTGSRLRIGGTAEAGEVALSGSITALTVRLAVTANSGASVWFDEVEVKKAGALSQTLVEYLTTTWEQAWTAVFGSGGAGKIWSDFVTAISTVKTSAGIGETGAGTNAGNILGIIDGIGQAVFGDAAYGSLPQTAKQSIRKLVGTLFGVSNPVLTEILAAAVPDLDGSIITTGTIDSGVLDTDGIGAEINPAAGSGAQISRRDTTNSEASPGPNTFVNGFYGYVDFSPSSDIQILNSSNAVVTGTGTKANLAGIYRVTNAGWYMVEICVKVNPTVSFGGHVAPLLYRSSNYPSVALTEYKTGGDGVASWWGFGGSAPRFVQSTFIVYLPANGAVRAGYSADGYGAGVFDADSDGTQTYFSISLLNKTYT